MSLITLYRNLDFKVNLPLELVDYICKSIGFTKAINYQEKLKFISDKSNYPRIPNNWKDWQPEDWEKVISFVNPDCYWYPHKLLQSFNDIFRGFSYYRKFGQRNNENPVIGDIIDAYKRCLDISFEMDIDTSYTEMVSYINHHQLTNIPNAIYNTELNQSLLFKMLINGTPDEIKMRLEYSYVINHPPRSEWDAFIAILDKGFDSCLANSRLVEYYLGYPVSNLLSSIQNINPYRLVVGYYFNPLIPVYYYTHEQLNNMCQLESISSDNRNEMYNTLTIRSFQPNFHHLIQPEVKQEETLYSMELLSEVTTESIVCYGVLCTDPDTLQKSTMKAYTLQELEHMFKSNMSFASPIDHQEFSELSINKLYNICRGIINANLNKELTNDAYRLIDAITYVRLKSIKEIELDSEFMRNKGTDAIEILQYLIELGMYMRGWNGIGELPVSNAPLGDLEKIENKIYECRQKIDKLDNELGDILNELKLVNHEYGSFRIVTDPKEGLTVRGRLKIIDQGNTHENMISCIRWSSKVIISTAYCHLFNLNHKPEEFNISELKNVG